MLPAVPLEPLRGRDPQHLGDYRLLGRLGHGGMGVAFLSQAGGKWVVVKMMRSDLTDDSSFRARVGRELEAMKRAEGPHTAALLESDLEGDPAWFAMEFIPGLTLNRRVKEQGALTAKEVDALAVDLAQVMRDVHGRGIVHRDLKPGNIMLSPTGPRLIDFGIADISDGTQLTSTGTVLGSTGWLAPEQVTGDPVTAATDVHAWALCVLYAATGQPPFGNESASISMYRVLETTPDVPSSIAQPLRSLLEAGVQKEPVRRPTIDRILAELSPAPPVEQQRTPVSGTRIIPPGKQDQAEKPKETAQPATTATPASVHRAMEKLEEESASATKTASPKLPTGATPPPHPRPPSVGLAPASAGGGKKNKFLLIGAPVALVAVGAIVIGVAASGGSSGSSGGPGVYSTEAQNSLLDVAVPSDTNNATVAKIEAYRKKVGDAAVYSYVTQNLRNNGSEEVFMCDIKIVGEDGSTLVYKPAFQAVGDMIDRATSNDINNEGTELYNSILNQDKALPGAESAAIYSAKGAMPAIKSVFGGVTTRDLMGKGCDTTLTQTSSTEADSSLQAGESDSSTAPSTESSASVAPEPRYAVKVNYESDTIPDTTYDDSLTWKVDVCAADSAYLSQSYLDKVALYKKTNGTWVKQKVSPEAEKGGRCDGNKINLTIPVTEPTPDASAVGEGWSPCSNYRVRLPETKNFAKTDLEMCVTTNAVAG